MNWRIIFRIQGLLLFILSLLMFMPIGFSIYYEANDLNALVLGMLITLGTSVAMFKFSKSYQMIRAREGFFIVTLGWLFYSAFSALPFYLHGSFGGYINCMFETMSGLTTTGATILTEIESIPKGLLFFRSLTHWLGGMGIILLTIAVLPALRLSNAQLFNAEVPGPSKDKLTPTIKETAKILWLIYGGMTVLQTALLMLGGMSLYDALCHTFGTLATGGFSTKNASVAGFNNLYFEIIIIIFMYLSGINFALHFQLIKGNLRDFFKDGEWRFYTAVLVVATLFIAFNIHFSADATLAKFDSFGEALRASAFQVVSITTTTGFCTEDFNLWPAFSKYLLIILMFFGGCAGSTGGGMKQVRIFVLLKVAFKELKSLTYPNAIIPVKIGEEHVESGIIRHIVGFSIFFIMIFAIVSLFLTFMGYDIITSFSAAIATLGNIGPGLAKVGAVENFNFFDPVSKVVLIFAMLLGRLEVYSVLIFFYLMFNRR